MRFVDSDNKASFFQHNKHGIAPLLNSTFSRPPASHMPYGLAPAIQGVVICAIASKRGGSEVFTYMPPSFHDREATQRWLPSPEFTPQEIISTILQAMTANRKFGCSIYLRFMSGKHEYSRLTAEDLQVLCLAGTLKKFGTILFWYLGFSVWYHTLLVFRVLCILEFRNPTLSV
jgi:hypothetical protein